MTDLLVADIGGTGSRLAVIHDDSHVTEPVSYLNSAHDSLESILKHFLAELDHRPAHAAFSVAGPVNNNLVRMTNLGWQLSAEKLARQFEFDRVELINDFEALAWATLGLERNDLCQIGGGTAVPLASRGILGPGTGLGVSGLVHNSCSWAAIAGEGGHVTMPATTPEETQLIRQLEQEFGHCSAERLLSGSGLAQIYRYVGGSSQSPENVTQLALSDDAVALQAVEIFSCMLGTVASNLALTLGARGGIYLAGGILPAICGLFARSGFRARFEDKGRFNEYLSAIPTFIITADFPSFKGLEHYMRL